MVRKKVGLALSGGATKGVSIFAIIEKINKEGVKIDYISGSSIGAIIGAYYALHGEVASFRKEILKMSKSDWFNLADFNRWPKKSLIKAKKYKEFLEKEFGNKKFSDLKIPLVVSVTNLTKGRVEYITKGRIVDAIIMSSAYPGIFPPVKKGGNIYADGGILDNLPYEILLNKKMSRIIVINLAGHRNPKKIETIFELITSSIDLMIENALKGKTKNDKKIFVFKPYSKKSMLSLWNFSDLKKKYNLGEKEFKHRRKEFIKWLPNKND